MVPLYELNGYPWVQLCHESISSWFVAECLTCSKRIPENKVDPDRGGGHCH